MCCVIAEVIVIGPVIVIVIGPVIVIVHVHGNANVIVIGPVIVAVIVAVTVIVSCGWHHSVRRRRSRSR
jgi:hypothetical protein